MPVKQVEMLWWPSLESTCELGKQLLESSSSRMHVMNHNWSARKQRLHVQSAARISHHFLLQAPQCPCSVRKQFSRDHYCRGRSKPGCWIVGSHTRWELTTWVDFQLCLRRLLMSAGCKSSHSSFLDVSHRNDRLRMSGWVWNDDRLWLTNYDYCYC